jgi:hypothetical protein
MEQGYCSEPGLGARMRQSLMGRKATAAPSLRLQTMFASAPFHSTLHKLDFPWPASSRMPQSICSAFDSLIHCGCRAQDFSHSVRTWTGLVARDHECRASRYRGSVPPIYTCLEAPAHSGRYRRTRPSHARRMRVMISCELIRRPPDSPVSLGIVQLHQTSAQRERAPSLDRCVTCCTSKTQQ